MQNLEEVIRDLAARGELTHLSLTPRGKGFSASFGAASPAGGYGFGEAADPVDAILNAIETVKLKRRAVVRPSAKPDKAFADPIDGSPEIEHDAVGPLEK